MIYPEFPVPAAWVSGGVIRKPSLKDAAAVYVASGKQEDYDAMLALVTADLPESDFPKLVTPPAEPARKADLNIDLVTVVLVILFVGLICWIIVG